MLAKLTHYLHHVRSCWVFRIFLGTLMVLISLARLGVIPVHVATIYNMDSVNHLGAMAQLVSGILLLATVNYRTYWLGRHSAIIATVLCSMIAYDAHTINNDTAAITWTLLAITTLISEVGVRHDGTTLYTINKLS